jgi:hypothetical protein
MQRWLMALAASLALVAYGNEALTFKSLLVDMTDLNRLTEFPSPAFTCKQFSSFDPASKTPEDPKTWFANADCGQYLRVEEREGRKEYVMMDATGPGAITAIWSTFQDNIAGVLRIYLDGAEQPALAAPLKEILGGKYPHLPQPFSGEYSRGWNLYLPIPYAKHCKVTCDAQKVYYHIDYRTYAAGTPVVTFQAAQLEALDAELKTVAEKLDTPEALVQSVGAQRKTFEAAIPPGGQVAFDAFQGEQAIQLFRLHWLPTGDRDEPALRACVLEMTFDGEKTVIAPLGDFFGSAPGINRLATLPLGVATNGTMDCRWVMPFQRSAAFKVVNHGKTPVAFKIEAVAVPRPWTGRSLLFHSKWRIQHDLPTEPKVDWNYLTAKGRGVFAGVSFNLDNPVRAWWGEGDEKIYVDGEKFPSHFGTGTEDYYGYAWCFPKLFMHAYHSQSRCDGPGNFGRTSLNRFHILDCIPFTQEFRFDMEIWHWKKCLINASVLACWYAAPGATDGFPPLTVADVTLRPLPDYKPEKTAGAIEGEKLRIIAKTGAPAPQSVEGDSDGQHLWWRGGQKPGDQLLLGFNVEQAGRYRVFARCLKARDYGIAQFAVNGASAGKPVDFYNEKVIVAKEFELGLFDLKQGENQLGITITGANPKAVKSYMVGLDYLLLKPAR